MELKNLTNELLEKIAATKVANDALFLGMGAIPTAIATQYYLNRKYEQEELEPQVEKHRQQLRQLGFKISPKGIYKEASDHATEVLGAPALVAIGALGGGLNGYLMHRWCDRPDYAHPSVIALNEARLEGVKPPKGVYVTPDTENGGYYIALDKKLVSQKQKKKMGLGKHTEIGWDTYNNYIEKQR